MASNAEFNLKRLEKTTLPMDFVRVHSGEWDHQAWLEFCASLEDKGYTPIDLDQIGGHAGRDVQTVFCNH